MDTYNLSYSYEIVACRESSETRGQDVVSGISGSAVFYNLSTLNESSEVNVSITAINSAGNSAWANARSMTKAAGSYLRSMCVFLVLLAEHELEQLL